jgi:hypothetical protein
MVSFTTLVIPPWTLSDMTEFGELRRGGGMQGESVREDFKRSTLEEKNCKRAKIWKQKSNSKKNVMFQDLMGEEERGVMAGKS